MASFVYPRAKAEIMRQTLDESLHGTTLIKAYAYDAGAHAPSDVDQFITDITAGALENAGQTMTGVTVSDDGEVFMADFTVAGFTGDTIEGVLYTIQHTALGAELLLYYEDDANWTPDNNSVLIAHSSFVFKM